MENLTLIIPAKEEADSLPTVLREIDQLKCKKVVILHISDLNTIKSIKNFDCEIIYQKNHGYGDALIEGINSVKTDYLCIFNADGSFDPKSLKEMLALCMDQDFVFTSRYLKEGSTEDDTILTRIGNFIFSLLGKILFSLKISDILYTYILGKTKSFQSLKLESLDFCLCVEIPVKAKRLNSSYLDIPSNERKRIAGIKKVNEFRDGLKILLYMIKLFFKIK